MYPSLFNDVFGPIMIGPSSSACAGPTRIGQIARSVCGGTPAYYGITYTPGSGRASFRVGMATNLGLTAGVLGWGPDDDRLYQAADEAEAQGMEVEVVLREIHFEDVVNPNAMLLTMRDKAGRTTTLFGDSVGGGTIEIIAINGFRVREIKGEEYVLLVEHERKDGFIDRILARLRETAPAVCEGVLKTDAFFSRTAPGMEMSAVFLESGELDKAAFAALPGVANVCLIEPIMPVVTRKGAKPPLFTSVSQLVALAEKEGVDCSEIAIRYEMGRTLKSREEVIGMMRRVWEVIKGTAEKGENGEVRHMRGPGHPLFAPKVKSRLARGEAAADPLMAEMLATAVYAHEGKNDMHTLSVAGPAAGCPPIMAGALMPLAKKLGKSDDDIVHALFTAAAIGAVTYMKTTPTGEITGCTGEVGVGSAMAAGAIVTLVGGAPRHAEQAASIALMNMFGLPCDPIAGGGCAMPCRGRSHTAPLNALASAELAMSEFDAVVPYDQVIVAMDGMYAQLPGFMKGSLKAGIPATPAAEVEKKRFDDWMASGCPTC